MTNAIIFCRVSTKEQAAEGYSLQSQAKLLQQYADKRGISVVRRYIVPESARGQQERKMFNEMMTDLKKSSVTILLCEKVDRMTRNYTDANALEKWFKADARRQVHFVKDNLVLHKAATSTETYNWDIGVANARRTSNNISEEATKGLLEKAEQGWYPGNKKRGYNSVGEIGRKQWVIDEPETALIRRMFELYDSGDQTLLSLSKSLHDEGYRQPDGRRIGKTTLHGLLTDCFYCGDFLWKGKKYFSAKHPSIISRDMFQRVQEKLNRKVSGKYRKHDFLFKDLKCAECGRSIVNEMQKGHTYLHCTRHNTQCSQKSYIREEKIEAQMIELLGTLKCPSKRMTEWIRKALKEQHGDEMQHHEQMIKNLQDEQQKITKRLDVMYDEKLDGKIAPDLYERKYTEYQEGLIGLKSRLAQLQENKFNYLELGSAIFELAQASQEIYKKAINKHEKRELLNTLFSNVKVQDGKLLPNWKTGIHLVAQKAESNDWLDGRVINRLLRGCFEVVRRLVLRGVEQAGHLLETRQMRQYNRGVSRRTNYLLNVAMLVVPDA